MPRKTSTQYRKSLESLSPDIHLGGKKLSKVLENPTMQSIVETNARIYDLADDPKYAPVMTAQSQLTGNDINRATHVNQTPEDLAKRLEMALLTPQCLGTCSYRCGSSSAWSALAATTWEMDQALGTSYYHRFRQYLTYIQENDLVVSVGSANPKGDRTVNPSANPDMYLRVVEKRDTGIVVRGAKLHQLGAPLAHEHLIFSGIPLLPGQEDFAYAFAVPNGEKGISYICQYSPYTAEREQSGRACSIPGSPCYGQRETAAVIFDDVFIPNDRIFLCGETSYMNRQANRQKTTHQAWEGACRAGIIDLIIGGSQLMAEYSGLEKTPHIQEDIANMLKVREISYALSVAAVSQAKEDPPGSGVLFPDETFAAMGVVYTSYGFWEVVEKISDITGATLTNMPAEAELDNPAVKQYIEQYFRGTVPARRRLRIMKFLQNWACGPHGAQLWVGGGFPRAVMMQHYAKADLESRKQMAERLAGLVKE